MMNITRKMGFRIVIPTFTQPQIAPVSKPVLIWITPVLTFKI